MILDLSSLSMNIFKKILYSYPIRFAVLVCLLLLLVIVLQARGLVHTIRNIGKNTNNRIQYA